MTDSRFSLQTVKAIKGAPASILWALVWSGGQPLSAAFLARVSGYTDKPITAGLALLEDYQFVVKVRGGWHLAEGLQLYLDQAPLAGLEDGKSRNNSDFPATAAVNLLSDLKDLNITLKAVAAARKSRNYSDILEKPHSNPNFETCWRAVRRQGIGEPIAEDIADSTDPVTGEFMSVPFIQAHIDSLAYGEGTGLLIRRLQSFDFPAVWRDQIAQISRPETASFNPDVPAYRRTFQHCIPAPRGYIRRRPGSWKGQRRQNFPKKDRAEFDPERCFDAGMDDGRYDF
jgi:hypothetical protein